MASPQGNSNRLRKVAALIVVLAIMAAAVGAVAFALVPYGSRSQLVWTEYRAQDDIDAVCFGSSIGAQSFDPAVVDDALGTSSFNMSTPSQEPAESYLALREVLENHDIDRVLYMVDYATFYNGYDMYPGRVFLNEKWKGDDIFQRFSDLAYALPDASWMFDEKSVNWLFPWTEQRVWFSLLPDNIAMQLDGTPLVEAAERNAAQENAPWTYYGKGYGNYDGFCDFNADSQLLYTNMGVGDLQDANLKGLVDMCDACGQAGVAFVAIVPPKPDFGLIDMRGRYDAYTQQLSSLVREHGGAYYDFNLAKPELFESREEYFRDWEHCNAIGAAAFSASLADLLARIDAGQDASGLFMTYDEKLESIDSISIATLNSTVTSEGIMLEAGCLAGSNVRPEYQFVATGPDGATQVVQEYSTDGACLFTPQSAGVYNVRVNARQQGDDIAFEKHTQHDVAWS